MRKFNSTSEPNSSETHETHPDFLTGLLNDYLKNWDERRQRHERQAGGEPAPVAAGAPKRFKLEEDGLAEAS